MKSRRKHTTSIISVILCVLLVFTQLPVSAWAAGENASGARAASFGGSGTADDPYTIRNVADLQLLAQNINNNVAGYNGSNVHYRLDADLDLGRIANWTPIGNQTNAFTAVFDGNEKRIENLTIDTTGQYQGLFGYVNRGTIKNLTLSGSVSSTNRYVGLIAGYSFFAKYERCTLKGSVKYGMNTGGAGPYGLNGNSTFSECNDSEVSVSPYGYTTDPSGAMGYKKYETTANNNKNILVDIISKYNASWVQTSFAYYGFGFEISGLDRNSVVVIPSFCNGGRYVKITYRITNYNTMEKRNIKLASHADIQIADNDYAALDVIKGEDGKAVGIKMVDNGIHSNGGSVTNCGFLDAQLNLYFAGTGGVTDVDTYWFGNYGIRKQNCYNQIYAEHLEKIDSGVAFSWQNINLQPGETKDFSFIIGVGEAAAPPQWVQYPITLTAEQVGMQLDVLAKVKDIADVTDTLFYNMDGGPEAEIGSVDTDGVNVKEIPGTIDLSDLDDGRYLFKFWIVNSKGATTTEINFQKEGNVLLCKYDE